MLAVVGVAQAHLPTMMVGPGGRLVPFACWFDLVALGHTERWSRHEVLHDAQEPDYLSFYLNAHVTGSKSFAFIGFAPLEKSLQSDCDVSSAAASSFSGV